METRAGPIVLDSLPSEFLVTPYKVYVSLIIQSFLHHRNTLGQVDVGKFSRLSLKLINSLDQPFLTVRTRLTQLRLGLIRDLADAKISSLRVQGAGRLMDILLNMKQFSDRMIHRSSLVGLFLRKMELYTNRLTFTGLTTLFSEFEEYTKSTKPIPEDDGLHVLWKDCPSNVRSFFAVQTQLMQVNERLCIDPKELSQMIQSACSFDSLNLNQNIPNSLADLSFIRYLNSLRVNDYSACCESLSRYFDSSLVSNKCWAVYNLAYLHYQLNHDSLCLSALKECISSSQHAGDDNCLQYCLLLLAKLLMRRRSTSQTFDQEYPDEDLCALLVHLTNKGLKCDLHGLSVISSLYLDQFINSISLDISDLPIAPAAKAIQQASESMAVKYSLNNILGMVYVNKAAHFAPYGCTSLFNLVSQVLLRMYAVETISGESYLYINDTFCIALRNVAMYIWHTCGKGDIAIDVLTELPTTLFSSYNSPVNSIWLQATAEILFEQHMYSNNFKEAKNALEMLRTFDTNEATLREVEFLIKKDNLSAAYEVITNLIATCSSSCTTNRQFFRVRCLILQAEILQTVSSVLKCIELSKKGKFYPLLNQSQLLLARILAKSNLYSRAIAVLRECIVPILSSGSMRQMAMVNLQMSQCLASQPNADAATFKSCLEYNSAAIEKLTTLNDVVNLRKALKMQALLHHKLGNEIERNAFAKKFHLISK